MLVCFVERNQSVLFSKWRFPVLIMLVLERGNCFFYHMPRLLHNYSPVGGHHIAFLIRYSHIFFNIALVHTWRTMTFRLKHCLPSAQGTPVRNHSMWIHLLVLLIDDPLTWLNLFSTRQCRTDTIMRIILCIFAQVKTNSCPVERSQRVTSHILVFCTSVRNPALL